MKTTNSTLKQTWKIVLSVSLLVAIGTGVTLRQPAPKSATSIQIADGQETHGIRPTSLPAQNA